MATRATVDFISNSNPFVSIFNSSNFILRGTGVINGRGQWWWDATGKHNSHHPSTLKAGRPNLVRLVDCTHVEISGVTLQDSPFWCLHPVRCSHVHVHNVTITSPLLHAWNSDGVDPDSSQHVLIEYNDIGVGDDHIAIKAGVCGDGSPNDCHDEAWSSGLYTTKNVTVRYNTFRNGMGVVALGSELSGGMQDILVHDNVIGLCAHVDGATPFT
jgi:polygalacturonase